MKHVQGSPQMARTGNGCTRHCTSNAGLQLLDMQKKNCYLDFSSFPNAGHRLVADQSDDANRTLSGLCQTSPGTNIFARLELTNHGKTNEKREPALMVTRARSRAPKDLHQGSKIPIWFDNSDHNDFAPPTHFHLCHPTLSYSKLPAHETSSTPRPARSWRSASSAAASAG